jgi:hypothetical protein
MIQPNIPASLESPNPTYNSIKGCFDLEGERGNGSWDWINDMVVLNILEVLF